MLPIAVTHLLIWYNVGHVMVDDRFMYSDLVLSTTRSTGGKQVNDTSRT